MFATSLPDVRSIFFLAGCPSFPHISTLTLVSKHGSNSDSGFLSFASKTPTSPSQQRNSTLKVNLPENSKKKILTIKKNKKSIFLGSVEEKGVATRTLEIQNYSDIPIQIKLEIEDEIKNGGLQIFYEGKATLFDGTCESTVEHGVSIYLNHVIVIHGHHLLKISLVFKPTAFGDSNGKLFIHSNENVSNVTIKMHGYCSGSHIRLKEDRVIYFEKKILFSL